MAANVRQRARSTQEQIELIPDKEPYQPGDVAEILVQAPFSPAEGLMTVARSGMLYTERFTIEDGSITLRVPIEDAHIPNLSVQVDLNGSAPRVDDEGQPVDGVPDRPAYASGSIDLMVPPLNRTLALAIVPEATELAPGESTTIDLTLTDADGEPVEGAELAVVVVDEAILALTGYQLADPVAAFYQQRYADTSSSHSREQIVLEDAESLVQATEIALGGSEVSYKSAANARALDAMPTMAAGMASIDEASEVWPPIWPWPLCRPPWPWRNLPHPMTAAVRRPSPCAQTSIRWRPSHRMCAPMKTARRVSTCACPTT